MCSLVRDQCPCANNQRCDRRYQSTAEQDADRSEHGHDRKGPNAGRISRWTRIFAAFTLRANQKANAKCDTESKERGSVRQG